jgi:DNA helicase-2/ATP-dependent DNA helicase PcrA
MALAGPAALGRSVLITTGAEVPPPWRDCPRIALTDTTLASPTTLVDVRRAFLTRTPVVYEMDERITKPRPGVDVREVWEVGATFDFVSEAVWRLATLNAMDARTGSSPTWPHARRAASAGAQPVLSGEGDVTLPDGTPVWCDGGPLTIWTGSDEGLAGVAVVPRLSLARGRVTPLTSSPIETSLAPDQRRAVTERSTRARIIAPAGSGKTRVLTERARHLLRSGVPAASLLLLAYNARAQSEMRARTSDLPDLQIQTINAMALSLINGTNGFQSRGVARRTILEAEVRTIVRGLHRFPRVRNTDPLADWLSALSEVRLGLRAPDRVEASFGGDLAGFAEFFPRYRQYLAEHDLVDFDEQIYLAIEVLLREWPVRFHAEGRAEVLLVDEFQDLRPADALLVRLLAGPSLSVFAVGDDDQTIYGYSGATPEWLVEFERYVPHAAHHALEVNYRCPAPVVRAADNLVTRNRVRVSKVIRPGPHNVAADDSLSVRATHDQVEATVARVRELLDQGAAPRDIVVLSRVNVLLFPVLVALLDSGTPVTFRDTGAFVSSSGVDSALAWLRLGIDPRALVGADIVAAARRPSRGISPKALEWMGEQSTLEGLGRLAARLDDRTSRQIAGFVTDVTRLATYVQRATSSSAIEFIGQQIGLDRDLTKLDVARQGKNKASTFDDMRALIALGRQHADPRTFESWLRASLGAVQDVHGVELATVHKVKGQEWPHVIVYDVSDGVFPHRLNEDLEEERRVVHVAITRCLTSLTIVADADSPSIFLEEMSGTFVTGRAPASRAASARGAPRMAPPSRAASRDRPPARPVRRTRSSPQPD